MKAMKLGVTEFLLKYSDGLRKYWWILFLPLLGCLAGCYSFSISPRPDNHIVPAVSFQSKMSQLNQGQQNQDVQWMRQFHAELENMDGWAPPVGWFSEPDQTSLSNAIWHVMTEDRLPALRFSGLITNFPVQCLRRASKYFFLSLSNEDCIGLTNFMYTDFFRPPLPTNGVPLSGRNNLRRRAVDMLLRIDEEHQTLLGSNSVPFHDRGQRWFSSSPQMVSPGYPVGVSLTVLTPTESPQSSRASTNAPGVTVNNYYLAGGTNLHVITTKEDTNKTTETSGPLIDFDPVQTVTLSVSTVLNSADTQDRIDYVSTFVYIYPFQEPANADVVLEDEFWKQFFSYQLGHREEKSTNFIMDDLCGSYDALQIRFKNVTTTVLNQNLNLGTLQQGMESDLSGTAAATIPILPAATASPSITAASKATSSMSETILKQLDQRSTYISPDAAFLRITQRGMSSVNLNGRFNEKVQIYVPPARDPIYVLQTNKTASGLDFQVKAVAQPVYSRVDALVVSLAVVRHPTKLRRSTEESFGLPLADAANNDFIVGVPRPSRVTLWKWDRLLGIVYTSDLDTSITANDANNEEVYFDSLAMGLNEAHPLCLDGFDEMQTLAFQEKISEARQKAPAWTPQVNLFTNLVSQCIPTTNGDFYISISNKATGTTIQLGLKDKEKPLRLRAFRKDFLK
jgi:hypothetical protein